jgi:hypothetical protein
MGHEHTKQYLYDKWSDHYQSGMPPMVLKNIAAYPVLEKNGVTLYTAPNNITERILSFTDHHGCHFDELEIENKQTCFYL